MNRVGPRLPAPREKSAAPRRPGRRAHARVWASAKAPGLIPKVPSPPPLPHSDRLLQSVCLPHWLLREPWPQDSSGNSQTSPTCAGHGCRDRPCPPYRWPQPTLPLRPPCLASQGPAICSHWQTAGRTSGISGIEPPNRTTEAPGCGATV